MLPLVTAILLGLIQGLCEFLPISSSGHLAIFQAVFGLSEPEVAFDIILHLATLLAVIIFYHQTLLDILSELKYIPKLRKGGWPLLKKFYQTRPNFRFGILIIAASVPTGIIGLLFKNLFVYMSSSIIVVSCALLITGITLKISSKFSKNNNGKNILEVTLLEALVIGFFQAMAITPGISRSGFTISSSLILGLRKDLAARFSFILSIPAILGALMLEIFHGFETNFSALAFVTGFLTAAISGYLALRFLVYIIKQNSFSNFAYYCWGIGLLGIIWSLFQLA